MSEPIPTDPVVDPDFPPEDPLPPEPAPVEPGPELPVVGGWLDAAARAEADAKQYADEQDAETLRVAGRMVPRNMDRPPTVEDGTDLIAGTGWNQYDPATSDLVQMWRWDGTAWQALDMSAEMIPVLDIGSATVGDLTGGRINVTGGPIVAGDPDGARIEIRSTGFHAFNGVGTETAHIDGAEGVFVGGEFRTSDALPGQVTLSDDAYVTHFNGGGTSPGIKIVPIDTADMQLPAGIGPSENGLMIYGGRNTAGGSSIVQANPTGSFMRTFREDGTRGAESYTSPTESLMRTYREDGTTGGVIQTSPTESLMRTYREDGTTGGAIQTSPTDSRMRTYSGNSSESGWVRVQPQDAELAYVAANNTYFSRIKADASEAFIYTRAGGSSRYLSVDADGVWVKTNRDGSWKQYNLEETAQDSGWQPITLASGLSGSWSPAWRNKGGVIYLRGRVTKTGNWTAGWNVLVSDVGPAARPASHIQRAGATRGVGGTFLEVTTGGVLQVWFENATPGTTTVEMSPMFYPLG